MFGVIVLELAPVVLARVNVIPVVSVMLPTPVIVTTLALVIVAVPTLELAVFIVVVFPEPALSA